MPTKGYLLMFSLIQLIPIAYCIVNALNYFPRENYMFLNDSSVAAYLDLDIRNGTSVMLSGFYAFGVCS